jgi:hypothetical protein
MTLTIRTILILTLLVPIAAVAQEETTETAAPAKTTTATTTTVDAGDEVPATTTATEKTATATENADGTDAAEGEGGVRSLSSYEVRNMFTTLLRNHPWELAMILKLDPSLVSNESFVAGYPDLADFLTKHPEIRRNPRFYLVEFPMPGQGDGVLDEIFEMLAAMAGIGFAVYALGWFIRTLIEQKRWSKLSKQQAEVHNKILDRFGTSNEVLEYIKTPAGTKFLESAPIPLHTEKPARRFLSQNSRVFWSIQVGVIVAIVAMGMLLVSLRFANASGETLFVLGGIGLSVGAGFIASAAVSMIVSRKLGLYQGSGDTPADDTGLVR